MQEVMRMASFVEKARFQDLSEKSKEAGKLRILDSLGVALGALRSPVPRKTRSFIQKTGAPGGSRLIGGGSSSPTHAAFQNSILIRYLDFNDSYLAPNETFHPSDGIGGLLALGEYAKASGESLILATALSYQIQAELSEKAPVRKKGFDHTVQLSYAASASLAKILALPESEIANAIAISGTANNALRVTRTGALSHWKGLAAPYTVFNAANAVFLAREGITGPAEIFEGNKGFKESIAGPFQVDWENLGLSAVERSIIKKYNAEIHSQSSIEGVLGLKKRYKFNVQEIDAIQIDIFDVAFDIIGGGEEGEKQTITTKEEADHSLPYLVAVALIDDDIFPEQFSSERINRNDVQSLLKRVSVAPSREFTDRFPEEMPAQIRIRLKNGEIFQTLSRDYEGFHTRPMKFDQVARKFTRLTDGFLTEGKRSGIFDAVLSLERITVAELMDQLFLD